MKELLKNIIYASFFYLFIPAIALGQDFDISINVAGGTSNYELTAGFDPQATDGYDSEFDQYAPPGPPPPAFDAALGWEGDRYYTQILAGDGNLSEHVYEIQLSYPEDNLITFSWDNTDWSGLMTSCVLQDAFGGVMFNVDMLTDNSLELTNPALNTLKLKITPSEAVPIDIYGCTDASALNYGYNCEGEFVGDPTMDDGCCEYPSGDDPDFQVCMYASANGTQNYDLCFGVSPDATDGFDMDIDQYAPPAPPPPSFDAALAWDSDRYYTQILATTTEERVYDVQLQYAENNIIILEWDNTGWSDVMTSCLLQDAFGGEMFNVDMLTDNSLELNNPAFNTLKLKIIPSGETGPSDIYGCTDPEATNYGYNCDGEHEGEPTVDDGCCEYPESYEGIIVINEINYNPAASYDQSDEDYEFIELYNTSDESVLMDGFHLTSQNIDFVIGDDVWISHGGYLVIARNSETYSGSIQWTGGRLENNTDYLNLKDSYSLDVDFVQYDDGPPWPTEPDAGGSTLELISPDLDNSLAESWQASYVIPGGTPGEPNSSFSGDVYGCTDPEATNYGYNCDGEFVGEPTVGDGCCEYPQGDNPDFQVCLNASASSTQNH